jgi:hypothetical protein
LNLPDSLGLAAKEWRLENFTVARDLQMRGYGIYGVVCERGGEDRGTKFKRSTIVVR